MSLDALLATLERRALDTPDTPCNLGKVSAEPAPLLACTLDTPDTPQHDNDGNEAPTAGAELWVLCFTPAGGAIRIRATSQEHAAWLLKMNSSEKI